VGDVKTKPQVSFSLDSKIPEKGNIWPAEKISRWSFWTRGYYVSTVERDEETVRKYIQKQDTADGKIDQPELF